MAQLKGIDVPHVPASVRDRFFEKVRQDGDCWVWTRARSCRRVVSRERARRRKQIRSVRATAVA